MTNKITDKIKAYLTPARRDRLYGLLMAILTVLAAHGVIEANDLAQIGLGLGYMLGVGGLAVAKKHVNK